MLYVVGNESLTHVPILDEAVCVSLCAFALRKGMNPSVPLKLGLTESFSLGEVTSLGEGKLNSNDLCSA